MGSGSPTPHTSTTRPLAKGTFGGHTFSLGKLHFRGRYGVAIAHAWSHRVTRMNRGYYNPNFTDFS